jgi:hypothetical protein
LITAITLSPIRYFIDLVSSLICSLNGVCSHVDILVERHRRLNIPLEGIHRPETAGGGVEIAGAVVVEVEVGVELFAREQVVVGCGAGGMDEIAERVVVVGVGDSAGWLRQRPYAPGESSMLASGVRPGNPEYPPDRVDLHLDGVLRAHFHLVIGLWPFASFSSLSRGLIVRP